MTSQQLSAEEAAERNLAAVDAHFHNEIQRDIDQAVDQYGDSIVWEAPARGVLLRGKAAVRQAYLDLLESPMRLVHIAIWAPKYDPAKAPFDAAHSWLIGDQRALAKVLAFAAAAILVLAGLSGWAQQTGRDG